MLLRLVQTAHFGKSELTNFDEVLRKHPEFRRGKAALRPDDVILLVSKQGNQLVFLHGFDLYENQTILHSTRLRIAGGGGRWNPHMLANYATQVGIFLEGLKTYEAHIAATTRRT